MGTYSKLVRSKPAPAERTFPAGEAGAQSGAHDAGMQATLQTSMQASKQANMLASKQTNKQASKQVSKHASLHERIEPYLNTKATYAVTYRYPPDLLEKLTDLLHKIRKEQHRKLTQNAVAVAALTFLLADYETYGEDSMLYRLLIKPAE